MFSKNVHDDAKPEINTEIAIQGVGVQQNFKHWRIPIHEVSNSFLSQDFLM